MAEQDTNIHSITDHLKNLCKKCEGSGKFEYSSSATWDRHAFGCLVLTEDVCDVCWGTGKTDEKGVNLFEQKEYEANKYEAIVWIYQGFLDGQKRKKFGTHKAASAYVQGAQDIATGLGLGFKFQVISQDDEGEHLLESGEFPDIRGKIDTIDQSL